MISLGPVRSRTVTTVGSAAFASSIAARAARNRSDGAIRRSLRSRRPTHPAGSPRPLVEVRHEPVERPPPRIGGVVGPVVGALIAMEAVTRARIAHDLG